MHLGVRWRVLVASHHSREVCTGEASAGSAVAARTATAGSEQDRLPVDEYRREERRDD
jgi:hypothetical protein